MTELNDELLVAYVDGQLAADQSKAIERVLQEDDVAAQRVEALRAANAHLEAAFDAMLAGEPIPLPAGAPEETSAPRPRSVGALVRRAGLVAWVGFGCLLGGSAAGFILYDRIAAEPFTTVTVTPPAPQPAEAGSAVPALPPATWEGDVVRAHALLDRETFALSLESESNADLVGFQISKALVADFAVPDLSGTGLAFQRAQLLQRDGKPLAQVVYLPRTGSPVALYARTATDGAKPLEIDEADGMRLATWTQGNLSLLLAGDLPQDRMRGLTETISAELIAEIPAPPDEAASDPGVPPGDADAASGNDPPASTGAAPRPAPRRVAPRRSSSAGQAATPPKKPAWSPFPSFSQ